MTIAEIVAAYSAATSESLNASRVDVFTSGHIFTVRAFGKARLLELVDGTGSLNVYVQHAHKVQQIRVGDQAQVTGHLFRLKTNDLAVWASRIDI